MAGEVTQHSESTTGRSRRIKRRIPIRIDMTPMVDIAFLLLIFYMVSTVFAMPQAMEITLPPEEDVPIAESDLLTVRVDASGNYWWSMGRVSESNVPLRLKAEAGPGAPTESLRRVLVAEVRKNPGLALLVLIHPDAGYVHMVNVLDEIELIERSWNAHTARQLGVDLQDVPRDRRFSFRYAVGDWGASDTKVIAFAVEAAEKGGSDDGV